MFKRDEMGAIHGGETVIAQGVKVEGDFTSSGNVIIEGEVAGSVSIEGDLKVGDAARIQANVCARNAVVSGQIEGNITITEKLDLGATSKVTGDVTAGVLEIAAGATVNGRINMGGPTKKAVKAETADNA